ncbi:GNAT family N-acetyltransferase [Cryobacterium sp. MDB1-18-2]|uniref:GNAT family N-acetyltransferase n=1 Tax=unclassified Cryobacterium TaxID=2649013 RepID=UPI0010691EF9|nr:MULTISPECIES: GNAT family N-acetyltransferase [unclassified Cryobacterium]MEB0287970.1 GNAT family N-acetyltransferase [Cryobacterium sp. 10S3]MEB0307189.1 GNAT family N-acetyltransferase [Cryobacterium sp. 10I1]TFC24297.1 GNAT family N-acetyltransferase [Cryobacterium sp. MDB1-18-2]TFC46670.1 GNAT family N-acetyltransferase [Cryobacterium sp. MDB1-18-1]WPX13056.1 GNAT family N-acetyltransferase [Cryobacterium sp. 10S3]
MEFVRVRLTDAEVVPLLSDLNREYTLRYGGGDDVLEDKAADFAAPDGGFIVLREGDVTVAGGGIRRFDADTCEAKRLWTSPAYRRQGYAAAVLGALEDLARELGYSRLRLETGYRQPEALAMYRSLGYTEIGNYGVYEHATGFERMLGARTM